MNETRPRRESRGPILVGGRIIEAGCWTNVRRKFFDVHAATGSPIAKEALDRIAQLYAIDKTINRSSPRGERFLRLTVAIDAGDPDACRQQPTRHRPADPACCAGYDRHSLGFAHIDFLRLTQGVLPRIEAGCPGKAKLATFVSVSPSSRRISMLPSTKFPT
jgi:Transposase IS66 family